MFLVVLAEVQPPDHKTLGKKILTISFKVQGPISRTDLPVSIFFGLDLTLGDSSLSLSLLLKLAPGWQVHFLAGG